MTTGQHYQVAIVGAGFCGTMVAVNLVRLSPDISIALIERNAETGNGLAYGTKDSDHLLNVRAKHMGAFADDPEHFWRWLGGHSRASLYTAQSFVPRRIYGQYLKEILMVCRATHPKLKVFETYISNILRSINGVFELQGKDGVLITADRVVLALGNFPPDPLGGAREPVNPYSPETPQRLADDGDVLIIGTGLTTLDLVVSLAKIKSKGTIHLLSRHGLLPREHIETPLHNLKISEPFPNTARGLLRAVRKEIIGAPEVPWQSVIDAFRPLNQEFWQLLNDDEKRRFLRHLRTYWDVHRHRCAAEVMCAYRALEQEGRLFLHAGSITKLVQYKNGWDVSWRPRGKTTIKHLTPRHVVSCTGPASNFTKLNDELIQNLVKNKLIESDPLHLGILSSGDYMACNNMGIRTEGLYSLGSLLKGKLYESVAVPELRWQAADLANFIVRSLREGLLDRAL